jgi:hypothetical protein
VGERERVSSICAHRESVDVSLNKFHEL